MRIEYADLSLVGDREDNQDRVAVAAKDKAALLIVIDGMGGHSDGSRAADTALKSLLDSFQQTSLPVFDPIGFLHMALSKAHDDVARLGAGQSIDSRPRATIAISLVQDGAAYWAHVGDSRVYWIRQGNVCERTRDHILRHAGTFFRMSELRSALPGVSDNTIRLVLNALKAEGRVVSEGTGRSAVWRRVG